MDSTYEAVSRAGWPADFSGDCCAGRGRPWPGAVEHCPRLHSTSRPSIL